MTPDQWSWLMAGLASFGLWLTGYRLKVGWWYAIGLQALYVIYGATTHQRGMIALSVVFTGLYGRNLWRWRHNTGRPDATKCARPCCADADQADDAVPMRCGSGT